MAENTRRYLCVNCDLGFDVDPTSDAEIRCPRCMRKNLVEQPRSEVVKPSPVRFVVLGLAAVVAAALVGGYALWSRTRPTNVGENVPRTPLDEGELRGHLRRLGVDTPENRALFANGRDVDALFGALARKKPTLAVAAMRQALERYVASHRLEGASPRGERTGAFLAPNAMARALRGRGRVAASSIEATLLAVVALREADVDARVAEVFAYSDGGVPDPSGFSGRYFVEVPADSGHGRTLVDVFAPNGRTGVPRRGATRTLNDVEAVAAAMTVRALVSATRDHDAQAGLASVEDALRLDPRSVCARSTRAMLLAMTGAIPQATEEAVAAEAIRADPPRLLFHASLLLASGEGAQAEALVQRAVTASPDFVQAHAMLATLALARSRTDEARVELERVQRDDPENEALPNLWAGYYLLTGNPDEAARQLDRLVAQHPNDPMVRVQAAYTFVQGGMRERALLQLRAALAMVQGEERSALLERIGQTFGIGILGELAGGVDAGVEPTLEPGEPPAGSTDLHLDLPTIGGGRMQRPSILTP